MGIIVGIFYVLGLGLAVWSGSWYLMLVTSAVSFGLGMLRYVQDREK